MAEGKRCCVSRAVLTGGDPRTPDTDYFSACVAPLAQGQTEYADAATEYATLCGGKAKVFKKRFCECGNPMPKKHLRCLKCAQIAARSAARERKQKQRAACHALTAKTGCLAHS